MACSTVAGHVDSGGPQRSALAVRPHGQLNSSPPGRAHRGISCYNPQLQHGEKMLPPSELQKRNGKTVTSGDGGICSTSFTFPNVTCLEKLFAETIWHDLVDSLTMETLQKRGRLNWLSQHGILSAPLIPLHTTGDGNCLLHAASLAMWGHHDRFHALRRAVRLTLEGKPLDQKLLSAIHPSCTKPPMDMTAARRMSESIHRRWMWQVNSHNMESCGGFQLTAEQWQDEWRGVLAYCSSRDNSTDDQGSPVYSPLEEVHIFTLAQVLRRPVVVIADKHVYGASLGPIAPIYYSGVYLPLLVPAELCSRVPVLLTYLNSHFCGLVAMDTFPLQTIWRPPRQLSKQAVHFSNTSGKDVPQLVPLEMPEGEMLELQFSYDPGEGFCPSQQYGTHKMTRDLWNSFRKSEQSLVKQGLICKYMNIFSATVHPSHRRDTEIQQQGRYFPSQDDSGCRTIIAAGLSPAKNPQNYHEFVSNYFNARVRELSSASYNAVSDLDRRTFGDVLYGFKALQQTDTSSKYQSVLQPLREPCGQRLSPAKSEAKANGSVPHQTTKDSQHTLSKTSQTNGAAANTTATKQGSAPPACVSIEAPYDTVDVTTPKLVADILAQRNHTWQEEEESTAEYVKQPSWAKFEEENSSRLPPAPLTSQGQVKPPAIATSQARHFKPSSSKPAALEPQPATRSSAGSRVKQATTEQRPLVPSAPSPPAVLSCRVTSRHELEIKPRTKANSGSPRQAAGTHSAVSHPPPPPLESPPKAPPTHIGRDPRGLVVDIPTGKRSSSQPRQVAKSTQPPPLPADNSHPPSPSAPDRGLVVDIPTRKRSSSQPRQVAKSTQPPPLPADNSHPPSPSPPEVRPRAGSHSEKTTLCISDTPRSRSNSLSNTSCHDVAKKSNVPVLGVPLLPITSNARDMILRNRVKHVTEVKEESPANVSCRTTSPDPKHNQAPSSSSSLKALAARRTQSSNIEPIYENTLFPPKPSFPRRSSDGLVKPLRAGGGPPQEVQRTALAPSKETVYQNLTPTSYHPGQPTNPSSMPSNTVKLPPPPVASKPPTAVRKMAANQRCSACGNLRTARTMTCSECFQHWQRQSR